MKEENKGRPMGQAIKIDDSWFRDHLGEMVRGTVEETLNSILDAETDELCGASKRFGIEGKARIRHRLCKVYEKSEELLARPTLDLMTRDRVIIEPGRGAIVEAIMWLFLRRVKPVKVSM